MKMALVLAALLAGCVTTQPPTPLKPGAPATTPIGCTQGQVRGVEC